MKLEGGLLKILLKTYLNQLTNRSFNMVYYKIHKDENFNLLQGENVGENTLRQFSCSKKLNIIRRQLGAEPHKIVKCIVHGTIFDS